MTGEPAVFLSASVPQEGRLGSEDFDPFLIKEAVSALIEVVLGRYLLVWGGQPAITPMIWEAARRYDVSYPDVVTLYQSAFFKDRYPEENMKFGNFVETPATPGDQDASLERMRQSMLSGHNYKAAIFIGGMEGIRDEYHLFAKLNPDAILVPIPSPGGYARTLFEQTEGLPSELNRAVDYTYWLYKLLNVDLATKRRVSLK